jgi:hypothetical protein
MDAVAAQLREGDVHARRADFEPEMFRGEEVAAFMQEQQDDKAEAAFPTVCDHRVGQWSKPVSVTVGG